MEKIQEIVNLIEQHLDDSNFAKSNISKIKKEIKRKKENIWLASEIEISIKSNERKVYLEFLYSFIIVGLILYLIF